MSKRPRGRPRKGAELGKSLVERAADAVRRGAAAGGKASFSAELARVSGAATARADDDEPAGREPEAGGEAPEEPSTPDEQALVDAQAEAERPALMAGFMHCGGCGDEIPETSRGGLCVYCRSDLPKS